MKRDFDLEKSEIFKGFKKETRASLAQAAIFKKAAKGKIIFQENTHADGLYFLLKGTIVLYKTLQGHREIELHTITPHQIFGEISLINQTSHQNFAKATENSEYLVIPKEAFEKIIKKDNSAVLSLSISISRKLSELRHKIIHENNKTTIVTFYNEGNQQDKAWLALETALYLQEIHTKPEAILTKEIQRPQKVLLIDLAPNPQELENILKKKLDYDFILINLPSQKDAVSASLIFNSNYLVNLSNQSLDFYKKIFNKNLRVIDIKMAHERKLERLDWTIGNLARIVSKSTIGLALGSGTVGGLCHIGVMKYLHEKKIPIDMIAGCSGGALYGAIYAYKKDISFIEKIVSKETKKSFTRYLSFAWSKKGFSNGNSIKKMFKKTFKKHHKIENLKTPMAIIATNISTQKEKTFINGYLWTAIHASLAIPIIFKPVLINNNLYSDGNITNPLPVDTLKKNNIDKTIAVYATQKTTSPKKKFDNFITIYLQTRAITNDNSAKESAKKATVFINPDVSAFGAFEYKKFHSILNIGYEATKKSLTPLNISKPI